MYPFQRLLIPTDFSVCAEGAYRLGVQLAQGYGAEVHLLHVAPPRHSSRRRQLQRWLDRTVVSGREQGIGHQEWRNLKIRRMLTQHADPVQAILQYTETHAMDCICIGAHGDNLASRFLSRGGSMDLLGQTAGQVVRHAPVPVLTVVQRLARAPERIQTILVPVDFSPLSLLALEQARDLAALYDANLTVLHVTAPPGLPAASRHRTNGNGHDPTVGVRETLVEAYEQGQGANVSVNFHISTGAPHREILRAIQTQTPDLLVIGAHAENGQDLLGEVAAKVVQVSPCSVLTVRGGFSGSLAVPSHREHDRRPVKLPDRAV